MEVKSFQKKLAPTDVKQKLSIPTNKYLQLFPSLMAGRYAVEFEARDASERRWKFRCAIRRNSRHPKPVISSKEWLEFVRAKGLKQGNKVIFSNHTDPATGHAEYYIRVVKKTITILGKDVEILE